MRGRGDGARGMGEAAKGVCAIAAAAVIWGLSGIYYKALDHVPPLEVLAQRTLWSMVFIGIVLLVQGRGREVGRALAVRRIWAVVPLAAVAVSTNWFGFIFSVQSGHALEASLGYYTFPLLAVALGFVALGERLSRGKVIGVALAAAAVLVLAVGLGAAPGIVLLIAVSFALYGLLKKQVPLGPVISVFLETLLLAPLALVWLWGAQTQGWADIGGRAGGHFGQDWSTSAMLVLSGPLTAVPLMLFSYSARRISYASLGLVQYLNPSLQFVVAVAVFGEVVTFWHGVAFPLIWAGLALYSWDGWREVRASRRRAMTAGTLS